MRRICWKHLGAVLLVAGVIAAAPHAVAQPVDDIATRFAASLTAVPQASLPVAGSIYVPAYSSMALSNGRVRADFSVTLSIHNVAENRPLVLTRIAYFDSAGRMVESFLKSPIALKPFATIEVFIAVNDVRGGTGANFVVDWSAEARVAEPIAEALMLGGIGNERYSFVSRGRSISRAGGRE